MRRPKNDYVPAEYGGYILNDSIPEYTEEDAGKVLKVNQNGVGIDWHDEIYDNTKNLLRNGKPTFSMDSDAEISTAIGINWVGWGLSRGSGSNLFEWGDKLPYFHFIYEASKTSSQSIMQLQKNHKLNNVLYNSAVELESLIPGSVVTLSFEIKSSIAFNLRTRMDAKDQNNTRIMRILEIDRNYETALADWTEVTVSDVIPYNFKDLFFSENTKDAFFMIQTKFIDDAHRANGDIYLRNIKLEYGKEATPYTYADIDQRLINYYFASISEYIVNQVTLEGVPAMDKTWQEIFDALKAKRPCYFYSSSSNRTVMYPITSADSYADEYHVSFANMTGVNDFYTDSPSGHPTLHNS